MASTTIGPGLERLATRILPASRSLSNREPAGTRLIGNGHHSWQSPDHSASPGVYSSFREVPMPPVSRRNSPLRHRCAILRASQPRQHIRTGLPAGSVVIGTAMAPWNTRPISGASGSGSRYPERKSRHTATHLEPLQPGDERVRSREACALLTQPSSSPARGRRRRGKARPSHQAPAVGHRRRRTWPSPRAPGVPAAASRPRPA